MHNVSEWKSCTILKMQFIDLLLVRWIFWRQIGHKNYEDFEHPTFQGATDPTRDTQGAASLALGYGLHWAFSPHLLNPKLE